MVSERALGGQTDKVVDYRGEHAQVRYTVYSVCVSVQTATAAQGSTTYASSYAFLAREQCLVPEFA